MTGTISDRILETLQAEPLDFKAIQLKLMAKTGRPTPDITVRMALGALTRSGALWRPTRGLYALSAWSAPATGPADNVGAWAKAHCATIDLLKGFCADDLAQAYRQQFKCSLPEDVFADAIKTVPHVVSTGLYHGREYYVRSA